MALSMGSNNRPVRVLQFTDTHFFRDESGKLLGVDTASSFKEVYKLAREQFGTPDLYLFTGDISQDETEESYRRMVNAVSDAGAPCYFLPGNHDRRHEMRRGLLGDGSPFKTDRQIIVGKWQIILLDSLIEGAVGGRLESGELEFLQKCLKERPEFYSMVCLHHHPVEMGARWLDQIGVENGSEFLNVLDNASNLRALLWGHVHQQFDQRRGAYKMMATPSTCIQFKKKTDDFGIDPLPPGYRWIELGADGTVVSEVMRTDKVARGLELSSAGY
jgi:Icc protein